MHAQVVGQVPDAPVDSSIGAWGLVVAMLVLVSIVAYLRVIVNKLSTGELVHRDLEQERAELVAALKANTEIMQATRATNEASAEVLKEVSKVLASTHSLMFSQRDFRTGDD